MTTSLPGKNGSLSSTLTTLSISPPNKFKAF
ncbi:uncharacterized protein METZ01_LOCUS376667, partial [marine metagenome]